MHKEKKMNLKVISIALIFALIGYVSCEKIPTDSEIISMVDKLDEEQSLPLFGGLALEKVESVNDITTSARSSESLTDRVIRYLQSHSVNFENDNEARSSVGGKIKPVKIIKKVKSTFSTIFFIKLLNDINSFIH